MHQNEKLRAVTAKLLFFLIKYADFAAFSCWSSRCLSSLLLEVHDKRNEDAKSQRV